MPIRARSSSSRCRCADRNFRRPMSSPTVRSHGGIQEEILRLAARRGQGREGPEAIRPQDRKHHARNPQHAGLRHGCRRRSRLSRAACASMKASVRAATGIARTITMCRPVSTASSPRFSALVSAASGRSGLPRAGTRLSLKAVRPCRFRAALPFPAWRRRRPEDRDRGVRGRMVSGRCRGLLPEIQTAGAEDQRPFRCTCACATASKSQSCRGRPQ